MSLGLLIIRLVIGITFIGHGAQKLFGWFGGHGLKGTGGWMESIGLKPDVFMAFMAGSAELLGGFLFAAGVFTSVGALFMILLFRCEEDFFIQHLAGVFPYYLVKKQGEI